MNVQNELRRYIGDRPSKQIAMTWHERWQAGHPEFTNKPSSVEAQFSRCVNLAPTGLRFFFGQRVRADLLFEILGVPTEEQAALWDTVQALLSGASAPPKVVIDLTPFSSAEDQAALFEGLPVLLMGLELGPLSLVLTKGQADRTPLGVANLDGVKLDTVESVDLAWPRVEELADEGTLVVSRAQYERPEHWLAMDIVARKIELYPPDGLADFARDGALPEVGAVDHPLADVGVVAEAPAKLPESPLERRRVLYELGDETSELCRTRTPQDRAALALALGVEATSTARERLEHELGELGRAACHSLGTEAVETVEREQLDRELELRKTRSIQPKVLRVDDELHLLVESCQPLAAEPPDSGRVHIHESSPKVILREFLNELEGWGEEDYLRDPYYDRLLERLAPPDEHKLLFHHARAFLLATGHHPPATPSEPADWRAALDAALTKGPPAAELLLPSRYGTEKIWGRPTQWLNTYGDPRLTVEDEDVSWWQYLPSVTTLLRVDRHSQLGFHARGWTFHALQHASSYRYHEDVDQWGRRESYVFPECRGIVSLRQLASGPIATWQGLVDASGLLPDYLDDAVLRKEQGTLANYKRKLTNNSLGIVECVNSSPSLFSIDAEVWHRADEYLGVLWLALRAAMNRPLFTDLHDGSVFLALGGAVLARLRASTSPSRHGGSTWVSLSAELNHPDRDPPAALSWERSLTTHRAETGSYVTQVGLTLPREVIIYSGGYRLSMSFFASALLSPGLGGSTLGSISGSVAAELDREARRREDDDD
ncbi:hypothetical protein [Enhygromyxa salina]|uniref:Uncharacterized protein n=1 Tax=Enhygromyxa salina TaxID=215803 RepID=A0A2S9YA99_9BACT|nr:hypothetical protein [Enhygromyxa salina]PRQ02025.1 hypothetical protein ENSA7_55980 [Enhygromyxa salina]